MTTPTLIDYPNGLQGTDADGNLQYVEGGLIVTDPLDDEGNANTPYILPNSRVREVFLGDSASPRVSIGAGVDWNSPFGPFRIDFAYALRKEPGDDTKTLSFNVGTQF